MLKAINLSKKPLALVVASSILAGSMMFVPVAAMSAETLEEIVVHGRKKAESLQDAPLVVNVFNGDTIDKFNLMRMEDIQDFTPGLVIGEALSNSGPNVSLRGVSTPPASQEASQSVSFVIDGFSISQGTVARTAQIDLGQVEILKGPQALYFGKNSTGGIISYRTNDPTDEFEVSIKSGYEFNADESYGQLIVSGPISDSLKGRLVMRYTDMKGWLDKSAPASTALDSPGEVDFANGVFVPAYEGFAPGSSSSMGPEMDSRFVRGTLLWEPTDELNMRTKFSYDDRNDQGISWSAQAGTCGAGGTAPIFYSVNLLDFSDFSRLGAFNQNDDCKVDDKAPLHAPSQVAVDAVTGIPGHNNDNQGNAQQLMFTHEMNYSLSDEWELTSTTGVFKAQDFYINNFAPGATSGLHVGMNKADQKHYSQEFRLESTLDGPINYTLGAFYGDSEFESQTVFYFPPFGLVTPSEPIRNVDTTAKSVFGQLSWDITDELNITGGVRWSEEEKEFSASDNGLEAVLTGDAKDRTFDDVSTEVTLTWQPADHLTLFGSYKEGFKSGGYNVTLVQFRAATPIDLSYDQETVKGYEVGAKTQWMDDRLRINTAIYYYDFTDLQSVIFDPTSAALNIVNAGELVTQGLEVDLAYLPENVEGLTLTASMAWNKSEYGDFTFDCYQSQTAAQGCNLVVNARPAQDLDGVTPALAPELQANFGLSYEFSVADGFNLEVNTAAGYSDEFNSDRDDDPGTVQDAYWKIHAGATLRPDSDKWSVSVLGRNLTDEYRCTSSPQMVDFTSSNPDSFCSAGRGRQIWVEGEYRF